MTLPFNLDNVGDRDAAYWVATELGSNRFLAKGNDKAKVIRDARAAITAQPLARKQANLAQG